MGGGEERINAVKSCYGFSRLYIQANSNNWQESGNTYDSAGTQIPLILPGNLVLCPVPSIYLS